jgi:Peptidase C13 family
MASYDRMAIPDAGVLDTIRARAFSALTPRTAADTHLSLVPRIYPKGHVLRLVDRRIRVPADAVLVFVDQMPGANFGHPCRYQFYSPTDGQLVGVQEALFPPDVADPQTELDHFHAPLAVETVPPLVYEAIDWSRVRPWPWLLDDNRFALLFTSQISNRRHVEDLEFAYRILTHRFGFPSSHIRVLCYDGTIGATDANAAAMATWVGDGTPYEMQVSASATKANLQSTLTSLSKQMNASSLLFVHTNNHGSPTGLCIDNSTVLTPSEWGTMLDGMKGFGTLVVTMEQCYSGAFSQSTLDHSKADRTSFASAVPADKVSAGASHFDPWAQVWLESVNGATAYGASLSHDPDANGDGRISVREAFDYSDTYDPAGGDDPQYADSPVGCGHHIHLTKAPSLVDIIRELSKTVKAVEQRLVRRPPLPDPAPDWASELMTSLTAVDALATRLELESAAQKKMPRSGKPAGRPARSARRPSGPSVTTRKRS